MSAQDLCRVGSICPSVPHRGGEPWACPEGFQALADGAVPRWRFKCAPCWFRKLGEGGSDCRLEVGPSEADAACASAGGSGGDVSLASLNLALFKEKLEVLTFT